MAANVTKENRWSLFRNKEKQVEGSPDFSGSININGVVYKLNGWVSEYSGGRYFSGTVRPLLSTTSDDDIPL